MNNISKKLYSLGLKPSFKKNTNSFSKGTNMPNQIKALIDALTDAKNRDDMAKVFADSVENGTIKKLDPITYRSGDYFIRDLLKFNGEPESKFLDELTKKNIKIAPQLVGSVTNGNYTTIITKIDGLDGGDLIPFSQGYGLLDDSAKSAALKDLSKLVNANVINQAIFSRGHGALFVTPKSKQIVIPSWDMLRTIEPNEKQSILNECHKILFNK